MRKLASVQRVLEVRPIEGADNIECARVLGWNCVVKKADNIQPNELVCYFEVDSVLPDRPEFEFLRNDKFRLRTRKFRKQISQGLIFPLSILPKGEYIEGQDVTELLGVTKYEPPIPACLAGKVKGIFPSFIPKTDEIRIQSIPEVLEQYRNTKCVVCEKIDGSFLTCFIKDGEFGVCSRNLQLIEDENNAFWQAVRKFDIETKLRALKLDNIALQGELVGPGIQGNKYNLKEFRIGFFNVYDITEGRYFDWGVAHKVVVRDMGLWWVPIFDEEFILNHTVDQLVELSEGKSQCGNTQREGIVIRPVVGRDFSFKVINPRFLLKYNE